MQLANRSGPWWISIPALAGAAAAFFVPGASGTTTAGATLLAVGALALLAGHTWGLMVLVPSHVTLVGRLWPALAHHAPPSSHSAGAIAVVLVTSLPAIALGAMLLPSIVGHLLADTPRRWQALFVAGGTLLLIASLIAPAL